MTRYVDLQWRSVGVRIENAPTVVVESVVGALDPIRIDRFETKHDGNHAVTVSFVRQSGKPRVTLVEGQILVEGPPMFWSRNERFACVLLQAVDAVRIARGRVLLHGAAVEMYGKAVVLTGPSDAGKTTMALDICLERGARLIANDHVSLVANDRGGFDVEPSHDTKFAFRSQALWLSRKNLYDRTFSKTDELAAYERKRVDAAVLGIETCETKVPLNAIVTIGLGMVPNCEFYRTPRDRKILGWHADITSRVRGADLLLQADEDTPTPPALPNLVDDAVWAGVCRALERLDASVEAYDAKGDVNACSEAIVNLVRGKEGGLAV